MLDPLTALSLAGTIVQFIDFGKKLLSQGTELYKSTNGKLTVDEEVGLVIADLGAVIGKIRRRDILNPADVSGAFSEDDQRQQDAFEAICDEAAKVAQELLAKIQKLTIKSPKRSKWEAFYQIVRRAWSKDEIDGLLDRLSTLKQALETRVLFALLYVCIIGIR
jgi:hypothetical protein